jgi:hypothetical protein
MYADQVLAGSDRNTFLFCPFLGGPVSQWADKNIRNVLSGPIDLPLSAGNGSDVDFCTKLLLFPAEGGSR